MVKAYVFSFDMQQYKGEDNLKLVWNELSYSNNLVKMRVVLGVFRHAQSKSSLPILGYLCSLSRYWSFFVGTLDSCSRLLKHFTFLVETRQSDFAELNPFRKQSEMQTILDSFGKKNWKRIDNGFGTKIKIENIQLFWNNLLESLPLVTYT